MAVIESDSSSKRLSAMKPLCVMVTGANGFAGQVLCSEAIRRGFHTRCATRSACELPIGAEPVIIGKIDGETDWMSALRSVDVVIHLAARVYVMKDVAAEQLAEFLKVNLHGTENLARQTACAGARRLVYVSSIKVNGEETTDGHRATRNLTLLHRKTRMESLNGKRNRPCIVSPKRPD